MNNPLVYVLTACHNERDRILRLLKDLYSQDYSRIKIVVVDDGSTDGTSESIKKSFPKVQIIKGSGSLWWTGSLVKGISWIKATAINNRSLVIIINADCHVENSFVTTLVEAINEKPCSLIGSIIKDISNKSLVDGAIMIDWKSGKLSKSVELKKQYLNTDFLTTKGVIYPLEVFTKIGNFDARHLPHYLSDYEFSDRAKRSGYTLLINTKSIVYNDSKRTGLGDDLTSLPSLPMLLRLTFSRKSKQNLLDHYYFIKLCCPPKYKLRNYLNIFIKGLNLALGR